MHVSTIDPSSSLDLSQYPYETDFDVPIEYWWHSGRIPLADLDAAFNDGTVLDVWDGVASHAHDRRIDCLVLYMRKNKPMAGYIEQPNTLVLYNLNTSASESMPFHSSRRKVCTTSLSAHLPK